MKSISRKYIVDCCIAFSTWDVAWCDHVSNIKRIDKLFVYVIAVFFFTAFFPMPVSATQLDIRFLGNDPWFTGPESIINSKYSLTNPSGIPECVKRVPLWVMDVGTTIPDKNGNLQMVVGGDTFYRPERAEESCRISPNNRVFLCERVQLPGFFDGAYRSDCNIDADCTGPPGSPMDMVDWVCDKDIGFCVKSDLHLFCNNVYDSKLLPGVVSFCYQQRGSHPAPNENPRIHGEGVCEWMMGDHHCLTELYDDTCDSGCFAQPEIPECLEDPCSIDCTRVCNHYGHCQHRNQTFHTVRIEADGEGGHRLRLVEDHPEYLIQRTLQEWNEVKLFGVYPGDYFRDPVGRLYLLTDTRTWLATSMGKELLRSGIGVYSFSENRRIPFPRKGKRPRSVDVWKRDSEHLVHIANSSDYILFARGSRFSELSVVHGMHRDKYENSKSGRSLLYLMGSGPACPPGQDCLVSKYTDRSYLARVEFEDGVLGSQPSIEVYCGLENNISVWKTRSKENDRYIIPLFSFAGFRQGNIIYWRDEYWHLSETPDIEFGSYTMLHLLRSPDGLNWFDGGSFPILTLENPKRTRDVYSSKWLPPKEAGGDLGFILSHWLTYDGYFLAESKKNRFRDYNMKTYRLKPPAPRSYLVHSNRYTNLVDDSIRLPMTLHQAANSRNLRISMQYCICEPGKTCDESCPPWAEFVSGDDALGIWRYAKLKANHRDMTYRLEDSIPVIVVPDRRHGKSLKPITVDVDWEWRKDIEADDVRVLLRFGLFSANSDDPFEEMLSSIRILPAYYSYNAELYNTQGGWHVTEPVHLH